ncbi:unnamed protein product [Adineta ricciae]|uniref:G-protein coupled receptors family 1 profile domain-containing protein n=1 Tax=Adineta ricciae TaxID=249248 RepID=A0A813RAV9_ADIRI|nr:unnamed protein product [Adineta ricciae]CAF1037254.1 unnamed protein product [Adineta ricciae]
MSTIEPWFIPFDILSLISTTLAALLALIYLLIIIFDKTCHTVSMMLVANTSCAIILFSCSMFSETLFTLQNDLQQVQTYDISCIIRAPFGYSGCAILNFSFTSQAFYRYMLVVYPTHVFYRSYKFQLLLVIIMWIYGFLVPVEFVVRGEVTYDPNNQICQLPLGLSFSIIYMASCIYVFPIFITMIIYYKLIRYVKYMNARSTSVNTVLRARYELKMVSRIVIIILILLALGLTYFIFILMSFFTTPPKYHFRIAITLLNLSLTSITIVLFLFTDQLKRLVTKNRRIEPDINTVFVLQTAIH